MSFPSQRGMLHERLLADFPLPPPPPVLPEIKVIEIHPIQESLSEVIGKAHTPIRESTYTEKKHRKRKKKTHHQGHKKGGKKTKHGSRYKQKHNKTRK